MNLSFRPLVTALAATLILNACSDDKLENAGPLPLQLSGVVAKGLVVGGKVTAYPIDANGFINIGTPLGSDETDAKGEYSIDITGYNGPIALVMKPVTGSRTKCDVPTGCSTYAFGDPMPFDFTMEAIIPNAAGGAISASVTPLTTMAAAYAKDLGLSTETAQVANEKVARLLGVTDILTTKPVDITDNAALGSIATSADALKYGYLAAAIARIAKTDNAGDTGRAMQNLAKSFVNNGGELVNNESTNNTSRVSLLEIAANAQAIMVANTTVTGGVFDATKTAIGMTASTAQAATADTRTLTNTDTVITVGDVTKAKAIVTELRTWAQTAREQLVTQVDRNSTSTINFAKKVDTAMAAGEDNFKSAFDAMALIGQAVGEAYVKGDGSHALAELLSGNPAFSSPGNTGTVVVNGASVKITEANINGNTVNLDLTAPAMSGMVFRLTTNTLSVDNPGVTWTSTTGGFIELQFDKNVTDILNMKTETNLGDIELTPANFDTLTKLTKISWNGGSSLIQKATESVQDPVSFTGTTSAITHVKYAKSTRFEYDFDRHEEVASIVYTPIPLPESIKFTGTFAMTNDKLEATFEGYVRNAESFTPKQPLAVGSTATVGSYAFSNNGNTLTITLGDNGINSYELVNGSIVKKVTFASGGSSKIGLGAYASMAAFLTSNNNHHLMYLNAQVDGNGYYRVTTPTSWNPNGGDLTGTLYRPDDSFEGATQWVDMDGKITFLADFADLPAATLSLSADRTGWKAGKGTATVSYGNVVITVDGEIATADNEDEPTVRLAILVDVAGKGRLEIYQDTASNALRGTVKADGKIVGIIQKSYALGNPYIVKYKDGSFESVAF